MTRPALLPLLAVLFISLAALPSAAPAEAPDKPNVIVIFTDDHGWADLASQGVRSDLRTPHLDAFATGGLRATNGYVTAPQCVPSRAALLTGRHQQRFGMESNRHSLDGFNRQQTIASRLKKAGYATGMTGKWHLGPVEEVIRHGFDDVFCTQMASGMKLRGWANFDLDGKSIPGGPLSQQGIYHVDANAAAACAFIDRHAREPFFFYLAFRAPHTPLDAPEPYTSRFPGPMPERRRQALAMISAIDDGIGRLMETLRKHGIEEKTLLFFMGDNGAPLKMTMQDAPLNADPGGWDGSINAPMNGEKGMLTEGGQRVPWLAYWKGRIPPGQVFEHPVISLDVAATAVALAGLPKDDALDGVNLLPYFSGESRDAPHEALHWRWLAQSAIREGNWKLLLAGPRSYLFDLGTDPGEKQNLIAQHPEIAQRLQARLEAWSATLEPPGLGIEPMSPVWDRHYDFFLEGKAAAAKPEKEAEWILRNGKAEVKNGALQVTPDGPSKQKAFVAFANLNIPGPATAAASLCSAAGGKAGFAWRLDGQEDFPPGQAVRVNLAGSPDWQEMRAPLPAEGRIIHLRVLLPPGETLLRSVNVEASGGAGAKRWSFGGE